MSAPPPAGPPGRFADAGLYALVVAIWGSSWIGLKLQVGADVAVLASVTYRFGLAGLLLVGLALLRRQSLLLSRAQHLRVAAQGIILFGVNYLCFYGAAQHLTSGLLAVAFSTVIVLNIILGALFLGLRLEARMTAGAVLGLGGIALVFWPEVSSLSLADSGLKGVLLALGGTACAAVGMTLSAANQKAGLKVIPTNAFGMLYGGAAVGAVAVVTGTPFSFAWTWSYAGGLAYLVVFSSVIAFTAYLTLLGRIGPARASYASVLFPVVALGISTVAEGYVWTPMAFGGVALVLMGNVLVLTKPKAAPAGALGQEG